MCDDNNWEEYYAERRKKKQRNKSYSTDLLTTNKIPFEAFRNGDHIVIKHHGYTVDYWPSTGLYIDRDSGYKARGIQSLLKYLNVKKISK